MIYILRKNIICNYEVEKTELLRYCSFYDVKTYQLIHHEIVSSVYFKIIH